jgi:hypothetical protein
MGDRPGTRPKASNTICFGSKAECAPQVVLYGITVTLLLGYRYPWVDRYVSPPHPPDAKTS